MGHGLLSLNPDSFPKPFILDKRWKQGRLDIIPVIKALHPLAAFTDVNADLMTGFFLGTGDVGHFR